MRKIKIPNSTLEVSALAYGTAEWGNNPDAPVEQLYQIFREAGGTTFDTAHCYAFWKTESGSSERAVGRLVKKYDKRENVIINTKGGHPSDPPRYTRPDCCLTPEVIASDVNDSLERLGMGYIDLYFLHRDDTRVPVGEIIDALAPHVQKGRIRGLGASHWSPARITEANDYAKKNKKPAFIASQPWWTLAHPNPPTKPYPMHDRQWHEKTQIALFAFSPTAHGYFSTGSNPGFDNPVSKARFERCQKLAREMGTTAFQISLAWLINQPFPVIPILGTLDKDHLKDAVGAGNITLNPDQVKWIEGDEKL